ncbi:hypothetical protein G6F61_004889 [Rhizopus arrhizus]|nr:hypothetical protein G6F61_004889 [Rhizopus arrhizus]
MVSAPTDDYIKWAQKAYPDEKIKLFPMSPERLCLFINHLSTHPKHGSEWCIRVREHPALVELLSASTKDNNKTAAKQPSSAIKTPQCVVIEGEKAKGYMIISDKKHAATVFHTPKRRSLPFPPRPGEERKRLLKKWQEESSLLEKNESLKNELSQKEKEIDRLKAVLDQYKKLLINQPEQECFIML